MLAPKRLKEIKLALKFTQEQMAEFIGVSFASINRWEGGHTSPTGTAMRVYKAIDKALLRGMDVSQCVTDVQDSNMDYLMYRLFEAAYRKEDHED